MGCYGAGRGLATLTLITLLLLFAEVMPVAGAPVDGNTDSAALAAAAKRAAAGPLPGRSKTEQSGDLLQGDDPNPDKRSVNVFPPGSTYYLSSKTHREIKIDGEEVNGIKPNAKTDPQIRGDLMTVKIVGCNITLTTLVPPPSTHESNGSCQRVQIKSETSDNTVKYICMNKKGKVYASETFSKNCEFIEEHSTEYDGYILYYSYRRFEKMRKKKGPEYCKKRKQRVRTDGKRKKDGTERKNKKEIMVNPCKWFLELNSKGKFRRGEMTTDRQGALFQRIDPNENITEGRDSTLIPVDKNMESTTAKPSRGGRGRGGGGGRGGGRSKGKDRTSGGAPFQTDDRHKQRHGGHGGSRRGTRPFSPSGNDNGPLGRRSGNARSVLSGMSLTSAEWSSR